MVAAKDVALHPVAASFLHYLDRVDPDMPHALIAPTEALRAARCGVATVLGERGVIDAWRFSRRSGLRRSLSGSVTAVPGAPREQVALFDRWQTSALGRTPADYDVLAIVTTYNEIEIIEQLLDRLENGGLRVHVIDNWSDDGTFEFLSPRAGVARISLERFPAAGSTGRFELEPLLGRVEEIAASSGADWVVHHDADEIRESAWPGVSLRDGLYAVERFGFNCIDHTIVNFRPTNNDWKPGDDLATGFHFFEFGEAPAHFIQLKAWKPGVAPVQMANTGGHVADFEGRRVFPYKFVTRHYPIRSQSHGERKVLRERQSRWSPEERARGWHTHYDRYSEGSSFLWDPAQLLDWRRVDDGYLLQRLSGAGLANNPFPGEGPSPVESP